MKLKIKNKPIIIVLIIVLIIGLFIILGIPLLSKMKEGFNAADAPALSTSINSAVNAQLTAAGLPPISEASDLFDELSDLMNQQIAIQNKTYDDTVEAEATTAVINTVVPACTDTSFFYGTKMSDAFCHKNSNTADLNNKCAALTADSCNIADCCVWVNGTKCAAGNADGPTIITGIASDTDYYLYKYQCYGNNCETTVDPCLKYKASDKNIPDNCLAPLWKEAGCSAPLPNTGWWKMETKASVENDMEDWAMLPDYTHRAACYGEDKSNWPDLAGRYKRVYGNNGSVSCNQYCNNALGKAELPANWKGATCAAAGQSDDESCSNVAGAGSINTQCICRRSDITPWET